MPKKKNEPNKSDFVRAQPTELSASEVVAKAKEAGLSITTVLVYKVRAKLNEKAGKKPKAGKKGKRGAKPTKIAKGTARKAAGGKLSASAFIRALPLNLSAKDATEKGAAEGYSFKPGLVYDVRAAMKKHGGKAGAAAAKSAPAPKAAAAHHGSSHRAQFRRLMIDLGLTEAEALYADVHRELKAIRDRA